MTESSAPTDVIFVGQTGIGKSTLINMVMGKQHDTEGAAEVSTESYPCTVRTTSYRTPPETGLRCLLWDTRGLGEAVDIRDRGWRTKIADWLPLLKSQDSRQARELKETLRDRTRLAKPILVWCIGAAKIEVPSHWQDFRKVYVEYCERMATPVIVVTQMTANTVDWKKKCNDQIDKLNQGQEFKIVDVPLLGVRKYPFGRTTTDECEEDSNALRDLISELTSSPNVNR